MNPAAAHSCPTRLDDERDLTEAFDGIRTVFIVMGSIGIEGVLQRIAINAAAGIPSIQQVTRLSVLNTSADHAGINQPADYSIDQFASSTAVPYSTIRPAIFWASLLAAAREVRAPRTWTGLAGQRPDGLYDHRDAAEAGLRVPTDPAPWGAHYDLTGRLDVVAGGARAASGGMAEPVAFRVAAERQFLERLIGAGVPAGMVELLIAREWTILACENNYTDRHLPADHRPPPAPGGRVPRARRRRLDARGASSSPDLARRPPRQHGPRSVSAMTGRRPASAGEQAVVPRR